MKDIRILHGELSPGNAMTAFAAAHPEAGGIVSFVGKVRPDKDVEELELRHYAPLTLKGMEELAEATLAGTRKDYLAELVTVPLLIIDDLGMRKLAHTAAEDLLELIMRRYERASTLLTSNRPVDDWGKLLGDSAAVTALLDRLLHHAHVLKCGPRSWRTKVQTDLRTDEGTK